MRVFVTATIAGGLAAAVGCNAVLGISQKELIDVGDAGEQGFDLNVGASIVRLVRGQSTSLGVSIKRRGGFSDPVTVILSGLPNGVTMDQQQLVLAPQETDGTLIISALGTANLGQTSLSVVATSGALSTQPMSVTLVVQDSAGSRDRTFGADGRVAVALAAGAVGIGAGGVKLAQDGSIVLCGWAGSSDLDTSTAVMRLTTVGAPDPTFGDAGVALARRPGSSADACYSMFLRAGGGINLAGFTTPAASGVRALMVGRFTPAGIPDQNTGAGGFMATPFDSSDSAAYAIMSGGPDDTFFAGGAGGGHAVIARYQKYGALESNFGSAGTGIVSTGLDGDSVRWLTQDSSGNVIAAVQAPTFRVVRLTAAGELDDSFGSGGASVIDVGGQGSQALVVLATAPPMAQREALLVVGTAVGPSGAQDMAVARLTKSGQLDATFGEAGSNVAHFGSGDSLVSSAALGVDGSIIVVGQTPTDSAKAFAVVRFTASGVLDATFGSGGRATFGDGLAQSIAVDNIGRIIVAGTMTGPTGASIAVYRLWP